MNNNLLKSYVHRFQKEPLTPLPDSFDFPHQYVPNEWVISAAAQLQESIPNTFHHPFDKVGKMFGILVVKTNQGIGFLAAFSGKINDETIFPGYVPPIFDTQDANGFYKLGESELNKLNHRIFMLENASEWMTMQEDLVSLEVHYKNRIADLKSTIEINKSARQCIRYAKNTDEATIESLNQESKKEQFKLRNLNKEFKLVKKELTDKMNAWQAEIKRQKEHRSVYSNALQKELFQAYQMTNFCSETKSIFEIFKSFSGDLPPSGTGECALPKLLHFAAIHQLIPICFGEFWWGTSPVGEVRKHKTFYPACRAKCEPLLSFLLKGISCQTNPVLALVRDEPLVIIYEDSWVIAVEKPTGVLSVPGRVNIDSAEDRLKHLNPSYAFLKAVHRLDMGTSGIMLFAKDPTTHSLIQNLFAKHKVTKIYEAILTGIPTITEGSIQLPLRLDVNHRPHQMVCFEHGKKAETYFKVLHNESNNARIEFHPLTGRTHQIRIHAAHQLGLNCPILGDELYGIPGARLHLHAKYLAFEHPHLHRKLRLSAEVPF